LISQFLVASGNAFLLSISPLPLLPRCRKLISGIKLSRFRTSPLTTGLRPPRLRFREGLSLIEVMIAAGLFFLATFTILVLVSATLRNAKALQRSEVDAGMAASQVYQLLKTNRQIKVSGSGDFGGTYPDYSFEFASDEYQSNGLLRVEIVVKRRGSISPVDTATIWVYDPDAKSVSSQPDLR
jgi:Tfp pilus assembly protein PilV